MISKNSYNVPVIIEQDKDGFFAFAPGIQGCYTQGDNYEEAVKNLKEAIKIHLLDRVMTKEKLPLSRNSLVSLTNLEVAI